MNAKSTVVVSAIAAAILSGCCAGKCCCPKSKLGAGPRTTDPVIGNWGVRLPYDSMSTGSFIFSRDENGNPKAFVLLRWGSPEWCRDLKIEGNAFSFRHPYNKLVRGSVTADCITGEIANCDKDGNAAEAFKPFTGWRIAPACPFASTKDAKFGEPIDLLKDGLDGWKPMEKKGTFGWSFENGVLKNYLGLDEKGKWKGGGVNLMTKRNDFTDFNLEYDVRVPKDSNSGVYLRGRYEIQVVDSYGPEKVHDRHAMAAYYGRATPLVAAEKPAGEWQHVSVTLYKRHLTVVLNGKTIIEDAEVTGVTGGAIDADVNAAGPIYLQGDHSDADYKNMILRPAI